MNFPVKIIFAFFLINSAASAQLWISTHAGMINYGGGTFYIDDEVLKLPEARFREVAKGKCLRTLDGWVELQLGPWAFLWLGDQGVIRMENTSLTDTRLALERGSALIQIYPKHKDGNIAIHSGRALIELKKPGLYRIDAGAMRIYQGKAQIKHSGHEITLRQGKAAVLDSGLKVSRFDVSRLDSLHQRALARSMVLARPIMEAQFAEQLKQARPIWPSGVPVPVIPQPPQPPPLPKPPGPPEP